jgi:hypothetical protein
MVSLGIDKVFTVIRFNILQHIENIYGRSKQQLAGYQLSCLQNIVEKQEGWYIIRYTNPLVFRIPKS